MRFCEAPVKCKYPVFSTDKITGKGYCKSHANKYRTDMAIYNEQEKEAQRRLDFIQWLVKYEIAKNEEEGQAFVLRWMDYLIYNGLHKGDCTRESQPCEICSLEIMLEEYDNYTQTFFK